MRLWYFLIILTYFWTLNKRFLSGILRASRTFSSIEYVCNAPFPYMPQIPRIVKNRNISGNNYCSSFRYLILHQYGGIYADMDIKCKKSMSSLIETVPYNTSILLRLTDPWGPSNDFIFAVPHHDFFKHVIDGLQAANRWYVLPYATTIFSTGPMYLWGRLMNYPFQQEVFVISIEEANKYLDLMHGSSWHSWDGVFIWWIFNLPTIVYIIIIFIIALLVIYCVKRYRKKRTAK